MATYAGAQPLTAATGFFFARGKRLFLVTSRHVLHDPPGHLPDRIEIALHLDAYDLTRVAILSLLLYQDGYATWRQGLDSQGEIDVAVIELDRAAIPADAVFHAFGPEHLQEDLLATEVGTPLLLVGFPLGFYDTVHYLPVVRQAIVASSFGIRFQGQGYFLTDARMHRGASGAPVVARMAGETSLAMPWRLLGVHAARMDMGTRDIEQDESLGLNCAWYADILLTLTGGTAPPAVARKS